jgi:pimeloyl-ACP methyl ester carboxylesterase
MTQPPAGPEPNAALEPDLDAEPDGYVVLLGDTDRIHFLDWGGPTRSAGRPKPPGVLLVHGLAGTAWAWAPVARRLRRSRQVVAVDLRGHGLSDSPTDGYEPEQLVEDLVAVAEGSGELGGADETGIILAGHGFGAIVSAWAAVELGERCRGLVLVDGGWEDLALLTGMEPAEFMRGLDEPPEVLRSMAAYLADREGFDPASWDADQERAARAGVVETHAGHVVPSIRPHALARSVETMFGYRPLEVLVRVGAPIVALAAGPDETGARREALAVVESALAAAGRPPLRIEEFSAAGHNLMRYRPAEVAAAIAGVAGGA